jgi:hypothetical protein
MPCFVPHLSMRDSQPFRSRKLARAALVVGFSKMATLACVETALRLFPPRVTFKAWHDSSLTYIEDDRVDWRLEPRSYS